MRSFAIIAVGILLLLLILNPPDRQIFASEKIAATTADWFKLPVSQEGITFEAVPVGQFSSQIVVAPELKASGDFGWNVKVALDANGGRLRNVRIAPGQRWSFVEQLGDVSQIPYRSVGGIPGGGWCNAAARYMLLAVQLGIPYESITYRDHGAGTVDIMPREYQTSIWTGDASQDVAFVNTTGRTMVIQAEGNSGTFTFKGWLE